MSEIQMGMGEAVQIDQECSLQTMTSSNSVLMLTILMLYFANFKKFEI